MILVTDSSNGFPFQTIQTHLDSFFQFLLEIALFVFLPTQKQSLQTSHSFAVFWRRQKTKKNVNLSNVSNPKWTLKSNSISYLPDRRYVLVQLFYLSCVSIRLGILIYIYGSAVVLKCSSIVVFKYSSIVFQQSSSLVSQ